MKFINSFKIWSTITLLMLTGFSEAVAPGTNGKIWFLHDPSIHFIQPDGSGLTSLGLFGSDPAGSPTAAKVAYDCFDGDWEICLMNSDGTNVVQLTNNTFTDSSAAWSPDGSKIAFLTDRDGNFEVYVMNNDGSNPTNLTNHPSGDFEMDWSPDGTKITFSTLRDYATGFFEIYVMNSDGSNPVNISNSILPDQDPSWSPDGSKIAFSRNQDIWIMNADGSDQQNLTNLPGVNDLAASWSPDGTKIAFNSDRTGFNDIYVMNPDGTDVTNLTNDTATDYEPSWQPQIAQGVCPQPQGFWKNNPSAWPVVLLTLGTQQYTQSELLNILNLSTKKDASVILARQMIAAKLNIAAGSDPAPVQSLITEGDVLLSAFQGKLPYDVKSNSSAGQSMVSISNVLDDYNKGYLTSGCTP